MMEQQGPALVVDHGLLDGVVPGLDFGVFAEVGEGVAALDGAEDPENGQIGQVGAVVAAQEPAAALPDRLQPNVGFVVQGSPDVVLEPVPGLEPLADQPHGQGAHVDHQGSLPGRKVAFPVAGLAEPVEGLEGFGGRPVDVRTEGVDVDVVHPLAPFPLLADGLLIPADIDFLVHQKVFVGQVLLDFAVHGVEVFDPGVARSRVQQGNVGLIRRGGRGIPAGFEKVAKQDGDDGRAVHQLDRLAAGQVGDKDRHLLVLGPF